MNVVHRHSIRQNTHTHKIIKTTTQLKIWQGDRRDGAVKNTSCSQPYALFWCVWIWLQCTHIKKTICRAMTFYSVVEHLPRSWIHFIHSTRSKQTTTKKQKTNQQQQQNKAKKKPTLGRKLINSKYYLIFFLIY